MPVVSQTQVSDEALKTGVAAWQHFAKNAGLDDTERFLQAKRELDAKMAEQARSGHVPKITETWKKVSGKGTTDSRKLVEAKDIQHNLGYPGRDLNQIASSPAQPPAQLAPQTITQPPAQVRSRYQDFFDQSQRGMPVPMSMAPVRPGSPSPPVPDCEWHPAYNTSTETPTVKLPRSPPVVKLPPSQMTTTAQSTHDQPVQVAPPANVQAPRAASAAVQGGSPAPASNTIWKDRFAALLNNKGSPEKRFAALSNTTSFSASKTPLEHSSVAPTGRTPPTAVTLPPQGPAAAPPLIAPSCEDEEALFEEPREMGFVPAVRMPSVAPPTLWPPAGAEPFVPPKLARAMALRPDHVQSVFPGLAVGADAVARHTLTVTVRIVGMSEPKVKKMSMRGASSGGHTGNQNQRGGYHHGSMRGKPRGRKNEHAGGANSANVGQQQQQQQPQGGPSGHPQARNTGSTSGMGPRNRNKSGGGANGSGNWTREASGVTA